MRFQNGNFIRFISEGETTWLEIVKSDNNGYVYTTPSRYSISEEFKSGSTWKFRKDNLNECELVEEGFMEIKVGQLWKYKKYETPVFELTGIDDNLKFIHLVYSEGDKDRWLSVTTAQLYSTFELVGEKIGCPHEFKEYLGFTDRFEYCVICQMRKI